jgi:hypothetical protein
MQREAGHHKDWLLNRRKQGADVEALRADLPNLKKAVEKAAAEHGTVKSTLTRGHEWAVEELQETANNVRKDIAYVQNSASKYFGGTAAEGPAQLGAGLLGYQLGMFNEVARRAYENPELLAAMAMIRPRRR